MRRVLKTILIGSVLVAAFIPIVATTLYSRSADAPLTVAAAKTRISNIRRCVNVLNALVAQPMPGKLSQEEQQQWKIQTEWFISLRARYSDHADALQEAISLGGPDTTERLAKLNAKFAALQEATQMESRKFQTLSNASRARHEAAMNSIRNIRA